MFTGIVETLARVEEIRQEGTNTVFTLSSPISSEFSVDQSISHNGVCLTVTKVEGDRHEVVAVEETLQRSNLGEWEVGHEVNLERSVRMSDLMDGHMVQGHVDDMGICKKVEERDGSWLYTFSYAPKHAHLLVNKGSISINGTSLTVIEPTDREFLVTIIPYTYDHTTFKHIQPGDKVNLEFDIIGKYLARYLERLDHLHR